MRSAATSQPWAYSPIESACLHLGADDGCRFRIDSGSRRDNRCRASGRNVFLQEQCRTVNPVVPFPYRFPRSACTDRLGLMRMRLSGRLGGNRGYSRGLARRCGGVLSRSRIVRRRNLHQNRQRIDSRPPLVAEAAAPDAPAMRTAERRQGRGSLSYVLPLSDGIGAGLRNDFANSRFSLALKSEGIKS